MDKKIDVRENRFGKFAFDGERLTIENRAMGDGFVLWRRTVCQSRKIAEVRVALPKIGESVSLIVNLPEPYPEGRVFLNVVGKEGDEGFKEQFLLSDLPFAEKPFSAFAHRAKIDGSAASLHAKDFSFALSDGGISSLKGKKELIAKGKSAFPCLLSESGEMLGDRTAFSVTDGERGLVAAGDGALLSVRITVGNGCRVRFFAESKTEGKAALFLPLAEGFDALLWEGCGLLDGEKTVGEYRMTLEALSQNEGESGVRHGVRILKIGDRSGYPFAVCSNDDFSFSAREDGVLLSAGGTLLQLSIEREETVR